MPLTVIATHEAAIDRLNMGTDILLITRCVSPLRDTLRTFNITGKYFTHNPVCLDRLSGYYICERGTYTLLSEGVTTA